MSNNRKPAVSAGGTRLCSLLLPVWAMFMVPSFWLVSLPVSFVVDSAVLLIMFTVLARKRGDTEYKPWGDWLRTVWLTWISGFVSNIIAAGFLLFWGMGPTLLLGDTNRYTAWWGRNVAEPIMANPFESFFAVCFVLLAIGLAGILIYFFNKNIALPLSRSLDVTEIRHTAMVIALVTAPWIMLLPSSVSA